MGWDLSPGTCGSGVGYLLACGGIVWLIPLLMGVLCGLRGGGGGGGAVGHVGHDGKDM